MTSDLQMQIFSTWLPLLIVVVFGLIGAARGVVREAMMAATIAIAAFINSQWAYQWGLGLNDIYNGWPQQGEQFWISLFVLWATALIVGYGVGTLLPRQPITSQSRLGGIILGVLNGAALAGWSLRYYITNTDGTLQPGGLLADPVARVLMIWAAWFPLILILLGTLVVLVGPLRRMQVVVGQPTSSTDWTPAAPARPPLAPVVATGAAAGMSIPDTKSYAYTPAGPVPPGSGAGAVGPAAPFVPSSYAPSTPGQSAPLPPVSARAATAPEVGSPPSTQNPPYGTSQGYRSYNYGSADSTRTRAFTPQPEPPTTRLPDGEATDNAAPQADKPLTSSLIVKPQSDVIPEDRGKTDTYSTLSGSQDTNSSWLLQAVDKTSAEAEGAEPPSPRAASSGGTDTPPAEGSSGGESPVAAMAAPSPGATADAELEPAAESTRPCPNCGQPLLPGALFCTNCGTKVAR